MTLRGDDQGFLIGEPQQWKEVMSVWTDIRDDVRVLRTALASAARARLAQPVATPSAIAPDPAFASRRGSSPAPTALPTLPVQNRVAKPVSRVAVSPVPASRAPVSSTTATSSQSVVTPTRDRRGRFVGGAIARNPEDTDASDPERRTRSGSRKGIGRRIWDARHQVGDWANSGMEKTSGALEKAATVDPAIAATSEVFNGATKAARMSVKAVQAPFAARRGIRKLLGKADETRGTDSWLQRILKELRFSRKDTGAFNRAELRALKKIEDKSGGRASAGGGFGSFLGGILPGGLLGAALGPVLKGMKFLGPLFKGIAKFGLKRLPLIGALFSAGEAFADGPEGETEEEKRKRRFGGIGGAIGGLAGAALGTLIGPVGTAIGGMLGQMVGSILGNWVSTLDLSAMGQTITAAWDTTVSFIQGTFKAIGEKWDAASVALQGVFKSVESGWNAIMQITDTMIGAIASWIKDKTGLDLGPVFKAFKDRAVSDPAKEEPKHALEPVVEVAKTGSVKPPEPAPEEAKKPVEAAPPVQPATPAKAPIQALAENAAAEAGKAVDVIMAPVAAVATKARSVGGKMKGAIAENWKKAKGFIVDAAATAGVDPGILAKIAAFESKFDDNARPIARDAKKNTKQQFDGTMAISTGHGYGQFLDGTWRQYVKKYGAKYGINGADQLSNKQIDKYRSDPKIQAAMLAEFTKENIVAGRKYGGSDDDANVYAMHNLGPGDAKSLLSALKENPNATVRAAFLAGAKGNSNRIESVISGNSSLYGDGNISVADAYKRMGDKMRAGDAFAMDARAALPVGLSQAAPPTVVTSPPVAAFPVIPTAKVPTAPDTPTVAPAMTALNTQRREGGGADAVPDVGQDISDRRIAHIVTGGLSSPSV